MCEASSICECLFLMAIRSTGHQLGTGSLRRAWPQSCSKCHPSDAMDGFTLVTRWFFWCLCECTLYLSFLTWLAMLPCPICLLVLALACGWSPQWHEFSLSPTLWLHSLLGAFAWLVLPWLDLRSLPVFALPCFTTLLESLPLLSLASLI